MKTTGLLALVCSALILSACSSPARPQPSAPDVLEITSPKTNQEFSSFSTIAVEGSVLDGASIEVSIGSEAPVTATLAAVSAGRRAWTAELTAPAPGSYTITAKATTLDGGPRTANVKVKIVGLQASGRWDGEFEVFNGMTDREKITGGSMVVLYDHNWFRMYFGANEVNGTTDDWDLIDKEGFRITGTYHAAGETNRRGYVMREPWIDYDAVMANGNIIEGTATQGD